MMLDKQNTGPNEYDKAIQIVYTDYYDVPLKDLLRTFKDKSLLLREAIIDVYDAKHRYGKKTEEEIRNWYETTKEGVFKAIIEHNKE